MNATEFLPETIWKTPRYYGGFSPIGDYCILTRNRDSAILDESNWASACKSLAAEPYDGGTESMAERPAAYHWRAGHWACGWVEYLMIRADAPDALQEAAAEIVCSLADYPVLDESDYSERTFNAACDAWERAPVRDRAEWCKRFRVSVFAARRDEMPADDTGGLEHYLSEG